MTNGHDLGDMGVRFRPDHTAVDSRYRRLGCAFLAALGCGAVLATLVCGAVGAIWLWR